MSIIVNGLIWAEGAGASVGGNHPDPPLDGFPLLVWVGGEVRTEDGRASVSDLAADYEQGIGYSRLAARHKTTADHVTQALKYASLAGTLAVRRDSVREGQWIKFRLPGEPPRDVHKARDGRFVGIRRGDQVRLVSDDRTDILGVSLDTAEDLAPVLDAVDLPKVVRDTIPANFRFLP